MLIADRLEPKLRETEAAANLRVKPGTLRAWRSLGRGPAYIKVGGRVRYDPADLEIFKGAGYVQPRGRG